MSGPAISVVIPTRNRRDMLRRTIEALDRQEGLSGPLPVIVADDGSTDGTSDFLSSEGARYSSLALEWLRLPAGGPATARNRGIALVSSARVLLLGDDTVPSADTVASHLAAADGADIGVQGRIEWDAESPVTAVMHFLAPAGPQFYFKGLRDGRPIPYTALYASNFSAPTRWFREEPFDEGFRNAEFEDTELAYRWKRHGYTAIYWKSAVCRHNHHYESIEPFLARQRGAGSAARYAVRKHPAMAGRTLLQPLAIGVLVAARHGLQRLLGLSSQKDLWDLQSRTAFFHGFFAGNGPRKAA